MLRIGEPFADGRYRILQLLGAGGMGRVFLAEDTKLEREVALKVLDPSGSWGVRALREARAAAQLSHPNAVAIFDVGEADGIPFLSMELVRGSPLRSYVGGSADDVSQKLAWLVAIARVLEAAHQRGLVHRDIKPENVMIADDDAVKVLDFGIARRSAEPPDASCPDEPSAALSEAEQLYATLTQDGVCTGTPGYMAPEAIRDEALDGRADQFSWAVTAFELLSGRHPFEDKSPVGRIERSLHAEPAPLDAAALGISADAATAIERALSKHKEDRFDSMAALLEAFAPDGRSTTTSKRARSLAPEPHLRVAATPHHPTDPKAKRGPVWLMIAACVAALGIGAWLFVGREPEPPTPPPGPSVGALEGGIQVGIARFENRSGRGEHDWLSLGLAEALGTKLRAIDGVSVAPRHDADLEGVTADLDVVIEGGFAVIGDEIRISFEARGAGGLLQQEVKGSMRDLFELQDQLATLIGHHVLGGEMAAKASERMRDATTRNVTAFEAYARGLGLLEEGELVAALSEFDRAIALDPSYRSCAATLRATQARSNHLRFEPDGSVIETVFTALPPNDEPDQYVHNTNQGAVLRAWSLDGDPLPLELTEGPEDHSTFVVEVPPADRAAAQHGFIYEQRRFRKLRTSDDGLSHFDLSFTTSDGGARTFLLELPKEAKPVSIVPPPAQLSMNEEGGYLMWHLVRDPWLPYEAHVLFAKDDASAAAFRELSPEAARDALVAGAIATEREAALLLRERAATAVCNVARAGDAGAAAAMLRDATPRPEPFSRALAQACILDAQGHSAELVVLLNQALDGLDAEELAEVDGRVNHAMQLLASHARDSDKALDAFGAIRGVFVRAGYEATSPYAKRPPDSELEAALREDPSSIAPRFELTRAALDREDYAAASAWLSSDPALEAPAVDGELGPSIDLRLLRAELAVRSGADASGDIASLGHAWPPRWLCAHRGVLLADAGEAAAALAATKRCSEEVGLDPPSFEPMLHLTPFADAQPMAADAVLEGLSLAPLVARGGADRLWLMARALLRTPEPAGGDVSFRRRLLDVMERELGRVPSDSCDAACVQRTLQPLCQESIATDDEDVAGWLARHDLCAGP